MELLNQTLRDRQLADLIECDVSKLPSVTDYRALPNVPAVYFIMVGPVVMYVGMSRQLRSRWITTHTYVHLLAEPQGRISYLILPDCARLGSLVEMAFIHKLKPVLNKRVTRLRK